MEYTFGLIMRQILSVFPPSLDDIEINEFQADVNSPTTKIRVAALRALSAFLDCACAKNVDVMTYIDCLFRKLLWPASDHIFQLEILRILATNFTVSNRNRLRVQVSFHKPVVELSKFAFTSETGDLGALKDKLSQFWTVWYPRVADTELLSLRKSPENELRLTEGYAYRRWQWLVDGLKNVPADQPDRVKLLKLAALKRGRNQPYRSQVGLKRLDFNPFAPLGPFDGRVYRSEIRACEAGFLPVYDYRSGRRRCDHQRV
jgi:hypothetical protein